jgi:hypothetical protein
MFNLPFHLPVLFSWHTIPMTNINYNLLRSCSIALMFISQFVFTSSSASSSSAAAASLSSSNDRALTIVQSIDEYLCNNYVFTCFFRQRHHQSLNQNQQTKSVDHCKSLLILHSCLHHDTDTLRICSTFTVNRAKINLSLETPPHCFTSSVYKMFYAQHLRSIAPSSITFKCQIFVLFFVLISFVIRLRACY